jgi:hypothetical protein
MTIEIMLNPNIQRLSIKVKIASLLVTIPLTIACSAAKTSYRVAKGTVKATCKVAGVAINLAGGTLKTTYRIGKYTYHVMMAPKNWPLTHDLQEVGGLSPKEAIRRQITLLDQPVKSGEFRTTLTQYQEQQ